MQKKITLAEIDSVKDNDLAYYRLMVQTRIEYAHRILQPKGFGNGYGGTERKNDE